MIDAERCKEIAKQYYANVYHYCLIRLSNPYDAADVTQNTFLFFQENAENLCDNHILSWLYSVAYRKIKEKERELCVRNNELIYGNNLGISADTSLIYELELDKEMDCETINEKKKEIIASLTEKEIELLELVYVKKIKYKRIAEELNISESAARTRVSRAKAKIKHKIYSMLLVVLLIFFKM